ncbi:GNAT family N-acetyltransferase [Bacillus sp. ISL-51]|uniref:GNAT family N-acetyltransferase n=1 Tax=Bacteria TaxID=2 RepID=UPI001BEA7A0A|nr:MULTISPECIES: GNAT family N-acetyltransferase [Bacteria]MBT2573866.1 GNAT family N-acetyltransferase [Bacillus sp. ISL-51]MBT2634802.1 GNAT family N-acetyltransferase [Bacillus sp. ISL-26]MBT2712278.1 GNAT family N-acetyltransferase [Pseudomonas sp. ISL-88]
MLEVKSITAEDTYNIRHKILRPHQTIEDCKYDQDNMAGAFHLGAFFEGTLISIASFYPQEQKTLKETPAYQLRGMATLPEYRTQKAGSTLIAYAERTLTDMGAALVWCNARYHVKGYYEKLGWKSIGETFDIPGIGPHLIMYKKLA